MHQATGSRGCTGKTHLRGFQSDRAAKSSRTVEIIAIPAPALDVNLQLYKFCSG
ncbi:MAG: hypothetical protein V7K90_21625 [Nostoc sp.]|uniref:hypothetical protein n=1 Tax=Nostoc sp. TaxID=1180 RepID=UPI002FFC49AF